MVKERNYGIDLFRLIAMLEIVILHILGHGGVVNALKVGMGGVYRSMGAYHYSVWCGRLLCIA